jgi:hypothetical protein
MILKKKCRGCVVAQEVAGCLFGCTKVERVMRELGVVMRRDTHQRDAMMEQLRQCPEAFKVGELVGKLFDEVKYCDAREPYNDRILPPAGAVLPPFV